MHDARYLAAHRPLYRPILSYRIETNYTRRSPQLIRVAGLAVPPVGIESSALNGFVPQLSLPLSLSRRRKCALRGYVRPWGSVFLRPAGEISVARPSNGIQGPESGPTGSLVSADVEMAVWRLTWLELTAGLCKTGIARRETDTRVGPTRQGTEMRFQAPLGMIDSRHDTYCGNSAGKYSLGWI